MITIDMEMPTCCSECFALDDSGDYPSCFITHESRGYNFDIFTKRMDTCPLRNSHLENNKIRLIDADALASRPRGRWIKFEGPDENNNTQYNCSNCGAGDVSAANQEVFYCWHCGAKMEGKFDE